MHACSPRPILHNATLADRVAVINGHLPLALGRMAHSWEKTCTLCAGKYVVVAFSNCVLGDLKCLAAALYSYSPNLEEMAQCSMITPLTF